MPATLIKNGHIVTAVDDYNADILVVDGKIQTIGKSIAVGADVEVHDAKGLLLAAVVPFAAAITAAVPVATLQNPTWITAWSTRSATAPRGCAPAPVTPCGSNSRRSCAASS